MISFYDNSVIGLGQASEHAHEVDVNSYSYTD